MTKWNKHQRRAFSTLVLYGALLFRSSFALAMNVDSFVDQQLITQEAADTLQTLSRSSQGKLVLLTKDRWHEKRQLVVLMGENHAIKCCGRLSLEKEVLSQFQYRAVEGAMPSQSSCYGAIEGAVGSTCNIFQNLIATLLSGGPNSAIDQAYEVNSKQGEHTVFWLEQDHLPDNAERFTILILALGTLSAVGSVVLDSAYLLSQNSATGQASSIVGTMMILLSSYLVLGQCVTTFFPNLIPEEYSRWIGINGLLFARNKTMARNLETILDQNPEVRSILVIVGLAHVHGIVKLLTREGHHFTEANIENAHIDQDAPYEAERLPLLESVRVVP